MSKMERHSGFQNSNPTGTYAHWARDFVNNPTILGAPKVDVTGHGVAHHDGGTYYLNMTLPGRPSIIVGKAALSRREAIFLRNALTAFIEEGMDEEDEE